MPLGTAFRQDLWWLLPLFMYWMVCVSRFQVGAEGKFFQFRPGDLHIKVREGLFCFFVHFPIFILSPSPGFYISIVNCRNSLSAILFILFWNSLGHRSKSTKFFLSIEDNKAIIMVYSMEFGVIEELL